MVGTKIDKRFASTGGGKKLFEKGGSHLRNKAFKKFSLQIKKSNKEGANSKLLKNKSNDNNKPKTNQKFIDTNKPLKSSIKNKNIFDKTFPKKCKTSTKTSYTNTTKNKQTSSFIKKQTDPTLIKEQLKQDNKKLKNILPENNDIKKIHLNNPEIIDPIIAGALQRKIIKIDNHKKTVVLLDENNNTVTLKNTSEYKITPMGYAHISNAQKKNQIYYESENEIFKNGTLKIGVVVIPENNNNCVGFPKETHLMCIFEDNVEKKYKKLIAILTSQDTGNKFSDMQYKDFENMKENKLVPTGLFYKKAQYISFLKNIEKINEENIRFLKWGSEYLQSAEDNVFKLMKYTQKLLSKKWVDFNYKGITIKDLKNACIAHDECEKNNQTQPLSPAQIDKQEQALKKQKEKNDEKKALKHKNLQASSDNVKDNS